MNRYSHTKINSNPKMSETQTRFLYVIVKEVTEGRKGKKLDTQLRIVYWPENEQYTECYVIYGKRPYSKNAGKYLPYRLVCNTKEQVVRFAETMIDLQSSAEVELHQFVGENDDSVDEFNIDWENTAENESTELVAYDLVPKINPYGQFRLEFRTELFSVLNVLSDFEAL